MTKKAAPPPRKTIRARGAIPAPVVAPKRVLIPWYKKRGSQAGLAFLALLLVLFLVNVISDLSDSREKKRLEVRAVEQFERKVALLNAPLGAVFQSLKPATDALKAGTLPPEEYKKLAKGWVEEFRKLYTGIKGTKVPADLEGLLEAKALYAQGSLLLVDAAKILAQASGPERDAAFTLAQNLLSHAGAVTTMGEREFQRLKNELELNDPTVDLPEALIPEEEAPVPPAAPPVPPPDPAAPPAATGPVAPEGPSGPAASSSPASSPAP